jgi:hypothetical protein
MALMQSRLYQGVEIPFCNSTLRVPLWSGGFEDVLTYPGVGEAHRRVKQSSCVEATSPADERYADVEMSVGCSLHDLESALPCQNTMQNLHDKKSSHTMYDSSGEIHNSEERLEEEEEEDGGRDQGQRWAFRAKNAPAQTGLTRHARQPRPSHLPFVTLPTHNNVKLQLKITSMPISNSTDTLQASRYCLNTKSNLKSRRPLSQPKSRLRSDLKGHQGKVRDVSSAPSRLPYHLDFALLSGVGTVLTPQLKSCTHFVLFAVVLRTGIDRAICA